MNKKRTKAKQFNTQKFLKREWLNVSLIAVVLVISVVMIAPGDVMADSLAHPTEAEKQATTLMISAMNNELVDYGAFPAAAGRPAPQTVHVTTTAYSSDVAQTDSTPFTTASGSTVRHGVVAANFLPIGTKIKMPKLYGDQIFVVEDRMNKRYAKRMDIWMGTREEAKQFGVRNVEIEIYK